MSDSAPIIWFTEDPTPILIAGGITLIVLLVFLLKTGRGAILYAMAGVAFFMGLAVLIDKLVVTDRERIEKVIYDAAAAAERNELSAVANYISPSKPAIRSEIQRWIGQVTIESVTVGGLNVEVDRKSTPPTAIARFWFIGKGKLKRGDLAHDTFPGRLLVKFQKEGDRWLVTDYERD
jgi:hypothetical protein